MSRKNALSPRAAEFIRVLAGEAGASQYVLFQDVQTDHHLRDRNGQAFSPLRPPPQRKCDWAVEELLRYEGSDFAEAVAYALNGRPASADERQRFYATHRTADRLAFMLAFDHLNRKARVPIRLTGIDGLRPIWLVARFLDRYAPATVAKAAGLLFRRRAERLQTELLPRIERLRATHGNGEAKPT